MFIIITLSFLFFLVPFLISDSLVRCSILQAEALSFQSSMLDLEGQGARVAGPTAPQTLCDTRDTVSDPFFFYLTVFHGLLRGFLVKRRSDPEIYMHRLYTHHTAD